QKPLSCDCHPCSPTFFSRSSDPLQLLRLILLQPAYLFTLCEQPDIYFRFLYLPPNVYLVPICRIPSNLATWCVFCHFCVDFYCGVGHFPLSTWFSRSARRPPRRTKPAT